MANPEVKTMLLSGDLYVDVLDSAGAVTGAIGPMSADVIEQQPAAEVVSLLSKGRGTYGQVISAVSLPQEPTGRLKLKNAPSEMIAAMQFGNVTTISDSGGSLVDEAFAGCVHDKWYKTTQRNFTTLTITDDPDTTPGWVVGTDYEVNLRLGMFRTLSTGSIIDGDDVLVDGTYLGVTGESISLNTNSQSKLLLRLDGKDLSNGDEIEWVAYSASVTPDQAIDLMLGEHVSPEFSIVFETPTGQTTPTKLDRVTRATS